MKILAVYQEDRVNTKIQKWGRSLCLRIPMSLARDAGVGQGTEVVVTIDGHRILIERAQRSRYSLNDLFSGIREDNRHEEILVDGVGPRGPRG